MASADDNKGDTSSVGGVTKSNPYDATSPPLTARSTTKKNHTTSNNGYTNPISNGSQGNIPLDRTASNTNVQMTKRGTTSTATGPLHHHDSGTTSSAPVASDHRIMPTHNAHQLSTGTDELQVEW